MGGSFSKAVIRVVSLGIEVPLIPPLQNQEPDELSSDSEDDPRAIDHPLDSEWNFSKGRIVKFSEYLDPAFDEDSDISPPSHSEDSEEADTSSPPHSEDSEEADTSSPPHSEDQDNRIDLAGADSAAAHDS